MHASVQQLLIAPDFHGTVEYFLASDPSAVIEHTNRVLFLEDGDIASIQVCRVCC
jgi:glucosamine--fructose-6-phosphate aminotransferase (isomerizing)